MIQSTFLHTEQDFYTADSKKTTRNSHTDKDALMQGHTHAQHTHTHTHTHSHNTHTPSDFYGHSNFAHTSVDADCKRVLWPIKKTL